MKLDYDAAVDSLHFALGAEPKAETREVASGVLVDFGAAGQVVGLSIQRASERLDLTHVELGHLPLAVPVAV